MAITSVQTVKANVIKKKKIHDTKYIYCRAIFNFKV